MTRDEMNLIEGYIDNTLDEQQLKRVKGLIECDDKFRNDLAEAMRLQGLGSAAACIVLMFAFKRLRYIYPRVVME